MMKLYSSFTVFMMALMPGVSLAMTPIDDEQLAEVTGQSLLVSDYIAPSGDPGSATDFGFYRMGLDALVELNMNIDKLQLGCGGFNEAAASNACDIDIDFLRLMGLDPSDSSAPGGDVTSSFELKRPYIELAIREGNTTTLREVAGLKVGAEKAHGYMSIGRLYADGATNQEHGGVCNRNSEGGADALACHSGINRLSTHTVMNLQGEADGCFSLTGLGWPCYNSDGPVATFDTIQTITGTRLDEAHLVFETQSFIGIPVIATIRENLRFIHGIAVDSDDFSLSFQRETIEYPNYQKDGYAVAASAGWWMNIPYMELHNLYTDVGNQSIGAIAGLDMTNVHLGQEPVSNCYGSYQFC